jgi:hypothetical protein
MRLSAVRRVVLAAAVVLIGAVGSTAYACSNLATIILSTGRGRAGATITLTGASFIYPKASTGQQPTKVVIHWQSENGATLAEAVPDRFGSISATFTVPEAPPGMYVITATQLTPRVAPGAPADAVPTLVAEPGTPARASFEVVDPASPTVLRAPTTEPVSEGGGDLDSTVWIVLTAAFGAVALSLFGGGLVAFIHQSRQAKVPAEARWVPPGWYS